MRSICWSQTRSSPGVAAPAATAIGFDCAPATVGISTAAAANTEATTELDLRMPASFDAVTRFKSGDPGYFTRWRPSAAATLSARLRAWSPERSAFPDALPAEALRDPLR